MIRYGFYLCLVAFAAAIACRRPSEPATAATSVPRLDILVANLDTSKNPGDDFFSYANGGWIKRNPIPASESSWGIGSLVRNELNARLRAISEAAARNTTAPQGTDDQKIGDFWTTAMDESKADRLGLTPLRTYFEQIDSAGTLQDVLDAAFALHRVGVNALFEGQVSPDEQHSNQRAVHLQQGGLGLPGRDFYVNTDAGVANIRSEYREHLQRLLLLLGRDDTTAMTRAAAILAFETALAKVSRTREELEEPRKNYYRLTAAQLRARTPSIDWGTRLHAWNVAPEVVILGQPEFFSGLDKAIQTTDLAVLRDYLTVHLVTTYAPFLSRNIDDEVFAFYGRVLKGQQEPLPRWQRVLEAENDALGMVLGRRFVRDHFPDTAKERYRRLVEAIRTAFHERIAASIWMSEATRAHAQRKLAAVIAKVGYPDRWKDYSSLIVGRASYCENMLNAARFRFDDNMARLGKPVDRNDWATDVTPLTNDAYYLDTKNDITLPAAVFAVPGVKDADLDDAIAYGNVGANIGHELVHGFDNDGRQYDEAGNLADWWTAADAAQFHVRADVLVKQFDAYEPLPGLHINGRATLDENIADYGGLLIALDAFKKSDQYRNHITISGQTPLQRFFLAFALSSLQVRRDQYIRQQVLSDVHAPVKWRVIGPVSNLSDFYEAFGIREGQPMWRASNARVQIW